VNTKYYRDGTGLALSAAHEDELARFEPVGVLLRPRHLCSLRLRWKQPRWKQPTASGLGGQHRSPFELELGWRCHPLVASPDHEHQWHHAHGPRRLSHLLRTKPHGD